MTGLALQSVGWALLHLLWQGALVAAVLALALRVLGRDAARARYALACGALVVIAALPAVTAWRHLASARVWESADAPVDMWTPSRDVGATVEEAPVLAALQDVPVRPAPVSAVLERLGARVEQHLPWLVLAWLLGVGVSSVRLLSGWLRLQRWVADAVPAPLEWQERLDRLATRLGMRHAVHLLQTAAVDAPAAVGWLRPVVLLPASALTGLSALQLELVLAHELAHVRRYDFAVNLLQTLLETLLFYHPAVWWVSHVIRVEREHCCDDIAAGASGNPLTYARALTALEALRVLPLQASPALSALGGSLPERVHRLVRASGARCSSRWAAGASVLTLVSSLAVAAPLVSLVLPERTSASTRVEAPSPVATAMPVVAPVSPAPSPTPALVVLTRAETTPHPSRHGEQDEDGEEADADRTRVGSAPLTVDQLVQLKVAGVTPERVEELEDMGYEPTVENLVQFAHAGVTSGFVREMREHFGRRLTAEELVQLKHLGVTTQYVAELGALGYTRLSPEELAELKAVGVTPEYVRSLKAEGLPRMSADELKQLRAIGVDVKFMRELRESGLTGLSVDELVQLRASGVDAEFIQHMQRRR